MAIRKQPKLSEVIVETPGKMDQASFPALAITQNNHKFYFATMPVGDIFPYCFVAHREEEPTEGFQRNLNPQRADDIARYLDDSQGSIPTNIVLSAQAVAGFSYNSKAKTIKYKRAKKAFLVIDGQHRLYGYSRTNKAHRVPVAIYEGLNRAQEASIFIDINTNQRGVPASLLLDIKQVAEQESQMEATLRGLFDKLAEDSESPLNGLLSGPKSVKGKISRVTFNRAVEDIAKSNVMTKLPQDKQYMLLKNYFRAVERTLRNTSLLRKAAYFEAFSEIFDDVMQMSSNNYQNFKYDSLVEVLGAIRNIDLESIPTGGKTNLTKATIVPILKKTLAGQLEVTEDMV
jgi:DGQHR domain-containing protein